MNGFQTVEAPEGVISDVPVDDDIPYLRHIYPPDQIVDGRVPIGARARCGHRNQRVDEGTSEWHVPGAPGRVCQACEQLADEAWGR